MRYVKYDPGQNPNSGVIVAVICDSPAHAGRVVQLGTFVSEAGSDQGWGLFPTRPTKTPGTMQWGLQTLQGDVLLDPSEEPSRDSGAGSSRRRFQLECRLCRDGITVRYEKLAPILDQFARHAEAWEIELTVLRASMQSA